MTALTNMLPAEQLRYRLRLTLLGVEPYVWRVVEVPGDLTLGGLHDVIQAVMGWEDMHLHDFVTSLTSDRTIYAPRRDIEESWFPRPSDIDEDSVTVSSVLTREGSTLYYRYDFGDGWEHEIRVEERLRVPTPETSIQCLDGQRACPPEDSGGAWGYVDSIERLRYGTGDDVEQLREWYGDFDPERFDLGEVQARLARFKLGRKGRRKSATGGRLVVMALQEPVRRSSPKIGRNDLCPCGSGRKHKKCCGG